jgi:hypothetical protein
VFLFHFVFALVSFFVLEGSLLVGCPLCQSVIEEKGEGFEKRKISIGMFGVAFNLLALQQHTRLKILYAYKSYESRIKNKNKQSKKN